MAAELGRCGRGSFRSRGGWAGGFAVVTRALSTTAVMQPADAFDALISCTGSGGSDSATLVSCGPNMKRRYESLTRSRQNVGQVYRMRRGGSESRANADGSRTPCARASRRFRSASSASLRASSTSQPNSSWKKRRLGWMRTGCQLRQLLENGYLSVVLTVQSPCARHKVGIDEAQTPVLHEVCHLCVS